MLLFSSNSAGARGAGALAPNHATRATQNRGQRRRRRRGESGAQSLGQRLGRSPFSRAAAPKPVPVFIVTLAAALAAALLASSNSHGCASLVLALADAAPAATTTAASTSGTFVGSKALRGGGGTPKRTRAPHSAATSSGPTPAPQLAEQVTCANIFRQSMCQAYGKFCYWSSKLGACVTLATASPTTSMPSASPSTSAPTVSPLHPTRSPTLSSPTFAPAWSSPTRAPSQPTTPQPTYACAFPVAHTATSCSSKHTQASCLAWTGCRWQSGCKARGGCSAASWRGGSTPLPTPAPSLAGNGAGNGGDAPTTQPTPSPNAGATSSTVCLVRQLALQAASALLPGCVRGSVAMCDAQRRDVFNALALQHDCGAPRAVPSSAVPGVVPTFGREPPSEWGPSMTATPLASPSAHAATTTPPKAFAADSADPAMRSSPGSARSPHAGRVKRSAPPHVAGGGHGGGNGGGAPTTPAPTAPTPAPSVPRPTLPPSTDFYVDPVAGSDVAGTGAAAAPFLTLERAMQAVRMHPYTARTVWLGPGLYRLAQTITLTPPDSGLHFEGLGAPGSAVITGAQRLPASAAWKPVGGGVYAAQLPFQFALALDTLAEMYANGQPVIRARTPNKPGYTARTVAMSTGGFSWLYPSGPTPPVLRSVSMPVNNGNFVFTTHSFVEGGACTGRFSPPASYFCSSAFLAVDGGCPYTLFNAVTLDAASAARAKLASWSPSDMAAAHVHIFHPLGWSMWSFRVSAAPGTGPTNAPPPASGPPSATPATGGRRARARARVLAEKATPKAAAVAAGVNPTLTFASGGFQMATGDCGKGGAGWYAENALPLLDSPNEFFLDRASAQLYWFPNRTTPSATTVELSALRTLIAARGTAQEPVQDILIRNVAFNGTTPTHMDPSHEVPSGGDWSVTRQGALLFEGVANVTVEDAFFSNLGGNGVFFSRYVRQARVSRSVFKVLGSSGVLLVGDPRFDAPDPWSSSDPNHVDTALVSGNVFADVGVYVKQSSGVFTAIATNVVVENNVVYDGPRAGLTSNDGFGGNNRFLRNVVFNQVLETSDHGPFNAWDRQKWNASAEVRLPNVVAGNLMLGSGWGGRLGVDLDDGSQNWLVSGNVLLAGLLKFKGSDVAASGNLVLFPQPGSSCALFSTTVRVPADFSFSNNTCVSDAAPPYAFQTTSAAAYKRLCAKSAVAAADNAFFVGAGGSQFFTGCDGATKVSFSAWRAAGQDVASAYRYTLPANADVAAQIRDVLPWF